MCQSGNEKDWYSIFCPHAVVFNARNLCEIRIRITDHCFMDLDDLPLAKFNAYIGICSSIVVPSGHAVSVSSGDDRLRTSTYPVMSSWRAGIVQK